LDVFVGIVFDFKEPLVNIFEGEAAGDVKDQEGSHGAFVVGPGD
jgi:hypothetical protein